MSNLFLFEIFSYSCMNCLRSLDYIKKLDNKYRKHGLKTILIHTPEWDFEKDSSNIIRAAIKYKIKLPMIIDRNRKIIYRHIREGNYKALEGRIRKILEMKTKKMFKKEPVYTKFPTIYAGRKKKGIVSELKDKLKFGIIYKYGSWKQNNESLVGKGMLAVKTRGKTISFAAKSINKNPIKINIKLNNKINKNN